jgi:hypothetical protein
MFFSTTTFTRFIVTGRKRIVLLVSNIIERKTVAYNAGWLQFIRDFLPALKYTKTVTYRNYFKLPANGHWICDSSFSKHQEQAAYTNCITDCEIDSLCLPLSTILAIKNFSFMSAIFWTVIYAGDSGLYARSFYQYVSVAVISSRSFQR